MMAKQRSTTYSYQIERFEFNDATENTLMLQAS